MSRGSLRKAGSWDEETHRGPQLQGCDASPGNLMAAAWWWIGARGCLRLTVSFPRLAKQQLSFQRSAAFMSASCFPTASATSTAHRKVCIENSFLAPLRSHLRVHAAECNCIPGHRHEDPNPRPPARPRRASPSPPPLLRPGCGGGGGMFTETHSITGGVPLFVCEKVPPEILPLAKMVPRQRRTVNQQWLCSSATVKRCCGSAAALKQAS